MTRRPFSKAELEASATPKGGYTAKQIHAWGLRYPPKTGWVKRLLRDGVPASCPYPAGFDPASVPVEPVRGNPLLSMGPTPPAVEIPAGSIEIYTDGSCDPNPGPGGWAFVVYRGEEEIHQAHGGEVASTNNRMELLGVIQALRWLDPSRPAIVWSDSQYVVRGCTEWRHGWRKKNWTRGKSALANADLWQLLDGLLDSRIVDIRWTRGHVGTIGNERADELAEMGRQTVLGDAGRAGGNRLAQSGRASDRNPVRARVGRRGKPIQEATADDGAPVLIKRGDPAVAALVRGGAA